MGSQPVGNRVRQQAFAFLLTARHLPMVFAIALAALPAPPTWADILHLSDGGRIDGEIIDQTADEYRVKTIYGTQTIRKSRVERVEAAPSVFKQYADRKAKAADTAA